MTENDDFESKAEKLDENDSSFMARIDLICEVNETTKNYAKKCSSFKIKEVRS